MTTRSFLSIPKWREMHMLHGLLIYIMNGLAFITFFGLVLNPDYRVLVVDVAYLVWLACGPFALLIWAFAFSNRHLSRP